MQRRFRSAFALATILISGLVVGAPNASASVPVSPASAAFVGPGATVPVNTVLLSNADNGRTLNVATGDRIRVHLTGSSSPGTRWVWTVPTASSPRVLYPISGTTFPDGDAEATFIAARTGTSAITAREFCVVTAPNHVCAQVIIPWRVTVVVD